MVEVTNCWYRISVKALIYDENGKILLCKEDNGMRDMPGGGLDRGENPVTGIQRELLEEMGLKTTYISSTPACFITAAKPHSEKRPRVANICYPVEVQDLHFTPSDECVEIGFFDRTTITSIKVHENVTAVVEALAI